jgi:CTP synthase
MLQKENLDKRVLEKLGLKVKRSDLSGWKKLVKKINSLKGEVKIGIVGKYTDLKDAYISIVESLNHGGYNHNTNVKIVFVNSEDLDDCMGKSVELESVDGILVPYGFGHRGIKGKINAVKYARENDIPFFGICLGLQCAVIEFARNVLELKDANSSEFDPDSADPVIDLMLEQKDVKEKGGTMRLGSYKCRLKKGSRAFKAYGRTDIEERHRHRFELNNKYRDMLEKAGMSITGINPGKDLAEIVEIDKHPWFVAVQFHPEFKSRPDNPHPLFRDFIGASIKKSQNK